jgi:hypothetical protein
MFRIFPPDALSNDAGLLNEGQHLAYLILPADISCGKQNGTHSYSSWASHQYAGVQEK